MKNEIQDRTGLPDALIEEKRFFPLPSQAKDNLPKDWNNPDNWCCIEDIPEDKCFGFAIGNDSNYLFIDADHVLEPETREPVPWVLDVYKRLTGNCKNNTYMEISMSGTGFHMICDLGDFADNFAAESNGHNQIIIAMDPDEYGKLPREDQQKIPKIEFFYHTAGRYVYLTGKHKNKFEVAKDEAAAAIFRELLEVRKEYHSLYANANKNYRYDEGARITIDDSTRKSVLDALPYISAENYDTWVHVGLALSNCGFPFETWNKWSRYTNQRTGELCDKYKEDETPKKWDSFKNTPSKWNAGTIFRLAQENGWNPAGRQSLQIAFNEFSPLERGLPEQLPEFPVDCLPNVLSAFIKDVAKTTEVPMDIVACEALSVLGACCMKRYKIQLTPSWVNPTNLYLLCVAAPAEGKSRSLSPCMNPFHEWIREENNRRNKEITNSNAKIKMLKKEIEGIENGRGKRGKGKAENTDNLYLDEANPAAQLAAKMGELEQAKKEAVKPITIYQDDITPEGLSDVMAANDETAVIIQAEGGFADVLAGRYNNGRPNLDLVNKSYDGEPYTRTRVGSGQVSMQSPLLTVGLIVQPEVLNEIINNPVFRGRGTVSRFMYCYSRSAVGYRTMQDIKPDRSARDAYNDVVRRILDAKEDITFSLDSQAAACFRAFRLDVEGQMKPDGEAVEIQDIGSRVAGNTARVMAIIHVVNHLDNPTVMVDKTEAENAIKVGEYFLEHAKGILSAKVETDAEKDAKKIWNKLKGVSNISKRDLLRNCRWLKTVNDMEPGLKELEKHGYICMINKQQRGGGVDIYVNPVA